MPDFDKSLWKQVDPPFWWPDARGFMIMSIILICGGALFVRMNMASPPEDKILDTMITVLFTGCLLSIVGYLFGNNRASTATTDTQNKIVERALATPPLPPPTSVDALGASLLSNGELAYFKTLTDDEQKRKFLTMSAAERSAVVPKATVTTGG